MKAFNELQLQSFFEQARTLRSNAPKDVSTSDYLQQVLMEANPLLSQEEAATLLTDIQFGIEDFNETFKAVDSNPDGYKESLIRTTSGMNFQDRYVFMINLLTALRIMKGGMQRMTDSEVESLQQSIKDQYPSNLETEDTLMAAVVSGMAEATIFDLEVPSAHVLTSIQPKAEEVRSFIEEASNALYVATAAYIASMESDEPVQPNEGKQLGAGIAAGFTQAQATADLSTGRITESRWKSILKTVGKVLLWCTYLYLGAAVLICGLTPLICLLFDLFGTGIFISFLSSVLVFIVAVGGSLCANEIVDWLWKQLSNLFVLVRDWVKNVSKKIIVSTSQDNLAQPTTITENCELS